MKNISWEAKLMLVLLGVILIGFMSSHCHAQTIPDHKGLVNDFAAILTEKDIFDISQKIYASRDLAKIIVVIVPDLQGYVVEDFTHKLAVKWGVGEKGKDNGLVILLAMKERKIRIEVGYGLESVIPDSIAKRIIEQDMKPYLKNNQWGKGLNAGVDAIIARLKNKK